MVCPVDRLGPARSMESEQAKRQFAVTKGGPEGTSQVVVVSGPESSVVYTPRQSIEKEPRRGDEGVCL